jgi:hypothetical protein
MFDFLQNFNFGAQRCLFVAGELELVDQLDCYMFACFSVDS